MPLLRCSFLCLILGAAPLSAQFVTTAPAGIHPGLVSIQVPLGPAFEARIRQGLQDACPIGNGLPPLAGYFIPDVKLRCVTPPNSEDEPSPPSGNGATRFVGATRRWDGSIDVTLNPTSWEIVGARLLSSPCGMWSYSAALDSAAAQASGNLTLWPEAGSSSRGTFTGTLPIAARLHLENASLGLTHDVPLNLDIPLRGSWTAPAPAPGAPETSTSNLSLFVWPHQLWRIHRPDCWEDEALWQGGEVIEMVCDRCVAQVPPVLFGSPPSSCSPNS